MSFTPETLRRRLAALEETAGPPGRYLIAFSGGLDSTVLLHALQGLQPQADLFAVHVDHGLQAASADWERQCRRFATSLGVVYRHLEVRVDVESGKGIEAAAREARYSALAGLMHAGDWLLSAHHREDQAETLLLNLIRGSGPAGIAGIGAIRRFGPGWLARPLLDVDRDVLKAYAESAGLQWVEDPSNSDRRFDRNFLRHEILPRLKARWPNAAQRLQRSAGHAGEAALLLTELAAQDLAALGGRAERLPIDGLTALSPPRQRNLIRHALRVLALAMPTTVQLDRIFSELLPAREDGQPIVRWPGAAVRRYRNGLYLLSQKLGDLPPSLVVEQARVELGSGLGTLVFEKGPGRGLSAGVAAAGLCLQPRRGGEKIQVSGQSHTRKLKKLLQEEGVVPWMRDRVPLIYAGDALVGVGDLWLAADAVSEPGIAVRWEGRPALH